MNKRQAREFTTLVNSRTFLRHHKLENGPFRAVVIALDDAIERVNTLDAHTSPARRSFGKVIRQRSNDLRRVHMIPTSRRGKILFRGDVDIENALRVPHARAEPAAVVAAAHEMIQRISPHRKLFLAAGFSRTFLAEMRAAAKELTAMVDAAGDHLASRPADFAELKRQLARGREEVAVADGLMLGWMQTQPPGRRTTLAKEWRGSHRITARLGRPPKRVRPPAPEQQDDETPPPSGA